MLYPGSRTRLRKSYIHPTTGEATDPTALALEVEDPDGAATTYTYGVDSQITKDSTGNYTALVTIPDSESSAGDWHWKWTATGTIIAAHEGRFTVQETEMA